MKKGTPSLAKILFIGNSFTERNDVPGLIAQLAAHRGLQLQHALISAGGASLRMHWNKGEAQQRIAQGGYDYVVLQEQSTLPVKNAARMHENIRLFDDAIRAAGAKTALYLTWARANAPDTQAAINEAYASIAKELGATLVPAGIAWQKFLAKYDQPALHDKDQSHPTPAGSYLAACVFLKSLLGEDPRGIPCDLKGLAAPDAEKLQKIAWAVK